MGDITKHRKVLFFVDLDLDSFYLTAKKANMLQYRQPGVLSFISFLRDKGVCLSDLNQGPDV